jgi:sugar phosphate isomerase/epimerase
MSSYTRKDFLKLSTGLAGALALSPSLSHFYCNRNDKLKTFGLQLYTIRDIFEKDPKGAIKQISTFGYKQLEGYERSLGLFWGMKNTEFKKYIEDLGMEFIASHCDTDNDLERKSSEAAAIGMKYLIHAWDGNCKTIDDYKKLAETFNKQAEVCKRNGVGYAFHNHYYSFQKMEDQFPQDILLQNTDPYIVDFEFDLGWAVAAGEDPVTWLEKYPDRFRLCHIKDRTKGSTKMEDTCDLGTGSIDFPRILKVAKKNGMQYYIAEQEHYPVSSLKSAEVNVEYMKSLKF